MDRKPHPASLGIMQFSLDSKCSSLPELFQEATVPLHNQRQFAFYISFYSVNHRTNCPNDNLYDFNFLQVPKPCKFKLPWVIVNYFLFLFFSKANPGSIINPSFSLPSSTNISNLLCPCFFLFIILFPQKSCIFLTRGFSYVYSCTIPFPAENTTFHTTSSE